MKKLSIVSINYNNASGLKDTLESICKSTLPRNLVEFIVIDGASSDESVALIEEYKDYIDYWVSEPDQGIFHAMNKGMAQASGEYINFMNSGDAFCDGILVHDFILNLKEDIVYGDIWLKEGSKQTFNKQTEMLDWMYFLGRTICHQSVFMRTELCKEYPFRLDYPIMGDWIQLFNILRLEQATVLHIPKAICIYDVVGVSNTQEHKRKEQREEFLRTIYSEWELDSLRKLIRLRGRRTYFWFLNSADNWSKQAVLNLVSRLIP